MFSFFTKRKPSPSTPPEEAIPGPDFNGPPTQPQAPNDEFIFVERKNPQPADPGTRSVYPSMPYPPDSGSIYPPPTQHPPKLGQQLSTVPFCEGIILKLAAELCTESTYEMVQMEVDGILALMTKQMQFENDYDFKLEREILEQYGSPEEETED